MQPCRWVAIPNRNVSDLSQLLNITTKNIKIVQIKTKNGHNEPSDKHSQSPVPKLDVSRLQTTPRSPQQRASQGDLSATSPDSYASSCSTPPSVTFLKTYSIPDSPNGELKVDTPKLYKQHDHQSDIKETVSVLEILRDARVSFMW